MEGSHSVLSPDAARALESHELAKVMRALENSSATPDDITSLNTLLRWSTANTPAEGTAPPSNEPKKTPEQLEKDRAWLDVAFPDPHADVKGLISLLTTPSDPPLSTDETVTALESLEELFADLNHAENIEKLGALQPLLDAASSPEPRFRAAAVWALGTALQDLQQVKEIYIKNGAHIVLARCLRDDHPTVRAKAVRAVSALLRHSSSGVHLQLADSGAAHAMRAALVDANPQVRRRARFFLQYARETRNEEFVRGLLADREAVAQFCDSIKETDVEDIADVETAVGALQVIVKMDCQGLLQVAPELPGVVDELIAKCGDEDIREPLKRLGRLLG